MKISSEIQELLPWMINSRRELHKIPETCYQEHKTSGYLQSVLRELSLPYETIGTGIVVHINGDDGSDSAKTIGFRADMDGLTIQEKFESDYKSKHDGRMHACGHDGHMAMLLGYAKYLTKNPPKCNICLVFQPAEEGGLGAQKMIDSGKCDANVYYALHIDPMLETGRFASKSGELMAGGAPIEIIFTGQSRHTSMRNGKQDALLACVRFLSRAEKILNTEKSMFQPCVIEGGQADNIIADRVVVKGSIRFLNERVFEEMQNRLKTLVNNIKQERLGGVEIAPIEKIYPPLKNSKNAYKPLLTMDGFKLAKPVWGSEDFALFTKKYSGAMIWLGAKPTDAEPHSLHCNMFNFDENAMAVGVQLYKELSENAEKKYLKESNNEKEIEIC